MLDVSRSLVQAARVAITPNRVQVNTTFKENMNRESKEITRTSKFVDQ